LMRDGQIVIEGTFEDLKKSRDTFVTQFLRGS
jgi:ABC-type transporter Mla maintaining outer membrane lipid asymmetry ATPase subunit MlaF